MTAIAVIPARYASTRFPGKPLANQTGKFLIQHVYERARAARSIDRVIVATDDDRILEAVASFGGEAVMTSERHATGTDRVAEVAGALGLHDDDVVLNVQGDEPEIAPGVLDELVARLTDAPPTVRIATLATPFDDAGPCDGPGSPLDPNCVKVVLDAEGCALYFSRSLVPHPRHSQGRVERPSAWLLHVGVYAFRADVLPKIAGLTGGKVVQPSTIESLEQLAWCAHGFRIRVCEIHDAAVGIDTPEDYAAFVERVARADRTADMRP